MRRFLLVGRRTPERPGGSSVQLSPSLRYWVPDDAPTTLAPPDLPAPDAWANDPDRTARRETFRG